MCWFSDGSKFQKLFSFSCVVYVEIEIAELFVTLGRCLFGGNL